MKNLLISLCLVMASCGTDQIIRGEDYVKTEKPEKVVPQEKNLLAELMPYTVWGTIIIGMGYWLWRDLKKSK